MTSTDPDNKENDCFEVNVPPDAAGLRLDKWLSATLPDFSRSRLKGLIEDGYVLRNGKTATDAAAKVLEGDFFVLRLPPVETADPEPEDIPLDILYEDNDLVVLNKPAGMVVHPGAGNARGTLVNALLFHCGSSLSGIGGVARPGIVHRLDKETSGVMVAAKNDAAHHGLADLFSTHDLQRTYVAVVHGAPRPGFGTIKTGIARATNDRKKMTVTDPDDHPDARIAITHYKVAQTYGQGRAKLPGDSLASLVSCELETGRTHQIRVHLAHLGHPLLGDPVYGRGPGLAGLRPIDETSERAINICRSFRRQALHARTLGFAHPVSGTPMSFSAEPPEDFQELQQSLEAL